MNVNEASPHVASSDRPQSVFDPATVLTSKELEVLELLSYGYENRDIATHFQTSGQAVKNMLRTINLKLGADNRTHAVAVCFRNGWLPVKETPSPSISPKLRVRGNRPRGQASLHAAEAVYHDGTIDSVCSDCGLVIARALARKRPAICRSQNPYLSAD